MQAFDVLLDLLASMQVDAATTTSLASGFGEFVYKPETVVIEHIIYFIKIITLFLREIASEKKYISIVSALADLEIVHIRHSGKQ